MNEQQAVAFFVAQSVGAARSMPLTQARAYLKGLLILGGDHQSLDALREVYADLCAIDEQFQVLQLQLSL